MIINMQKITLHFNSSSQHLIIYKHKLIYNQVHIHEMHLDKCLIVTIAQMAENIKRKS